MEKTTVRITADQAGGPVPAELRGLTESDRLTAVFGTHSQGDGRHVGPTPTVPCVELTIERAEPQS